MKKCRIHIYDLEVHVYVDDSLTEKVTLDATNLINASAEKDPSAPSGKTITNNYGCLVEYLNLPLNTSVYDYRTSTADADIDEEEEEQYACCDGCGHSGPDVYNDGFGYNICTVNRCTQYSVRGLSPSDFY